MSIVPLIIVTGASATFMALRNSLLNVLVPSGTIDRTSHVRGLISDIGFILTLSFLVHEVVGGSYIIMSICFNAFDGVISIKAKLFQDLLVNCVV